MGQSQSSIVFIALWRSTPYFAGQLLLVVTQAFIFDSLSLSFTGYRRLHQEGVRQEVQSHMALHRRPQFRLIRNARDTPLHLLLLGSGRCAALQERLDACTSNCAKDKQQTNHTEAADPPTERERRSKLARARDNHTHKQTEAGDGEQGCTDETRVRWGC